MKGWNTFSEKLNKQISGRGGLLLWETEPTITNEDNEQTFLFNKKHDGEFCFFSYFDILNLAASVWQVFLQGKLKWHWKGIWWGDKTETEVQYQIFWGGKLDWHLSGNLPKGSFSKKWKLRGGGGVVERDRSYIRGKLKWHRAQHTSPLGKPHKALCSAM